jgi:hypothetical protein
VSISEDELMEHKARVPQALIENPKLLRQKQEALRQAKSKTNTHTFIFDN